LEIRRAGGRARFACCSAGAISRTLADPDTRIAHARREVSVSRKRQLPPDIVHSKKFRAMSRDARLVYLLLYTIADDEGRMREDPGFFAYELFPGETGFGLRIEACLREMEREQLVARYDVRRSRYLVILDWHLQKIDHPTPSKLPPPPATRALPFDELSAARAKREG
jgi:hypothetical protein